MDFRLPYSQLRDWWSYPEKDGRWHWPTFTCERCGYWTGVEPYTDFSNMYDQYALARLDERDPDQLSKSCPQCYRGRYWCPSERISRFGYTEGATGTIVKVMAFAAAGGFWEVPGVSENKFRRWGQTNLEGSDPLGVFDEEWLAWDDLATRLLNERDAAFRVLNRRIGLAQSKADSLRWPAVA